MRGKGTSRIASKLVVRITPAYAGKSDFDKSEKCTGKDHPRLCGEKVNGILLYTENTGSPPPMRGKALSGAAMWSVCRITPAYAGKRLLKAVVYRFI